MRPGVIFTADDFGLCPEVNRAVIRAHREGVLTHASLMVTGDAFEEAVALARGTSTLAVGLHLTVTDSRPVLRPADVPHLVDATGRFRYSPTAAGVRYGSSQLARAELAEEIRAQFVRFAATGLPLSHVDGHMHMHVHPAVLHCVLPLAAEFGAKRIRIPRDDLRLAFEHDQQGAAGKLATAGTFAVLGRLARRKLEKFRRRTGYPLVSSERTYGLFHSGRMTEAYVLELIRRLDTRTAEIYFHPAQGVRLDQQGPNPVDLATLVSPAIGRMVKDMQAMARASGRT